MVLLTLTAAAKAAIDEYCTLPKDGKAAQDDGAAARLEALRHADLGTPIEHEDLLKISTRLTQKCRQDGEESIPKSWRLDSLLKGARVYQAPLPPKPEPVRSAIRLLLETYLNQNRHQNTKHSCAVCERKKKSANTSA